MVFVIGCRFPSFSNSTGKEVEISFCYDQSNSLVFKGIISKHSLKIQRGFQDNKTNNLLVIECVDKAVKLSNTYTSEIYEDKLDSDIINSLISNASGVSKNVSFTSVMNDFLPKYNCNDWDFILQRAEANGMVVLNSDNAITVTEPKPLLSMPLKTMSKKVLLTGIIPGLYTTLFISLKFLLLKFIHIKKASPTRFFSGTKPQYLLSLL